MNELVDKLYYFLTNVEYEKDMLKQHLIMIMSDYEISEKCTDIVVYNGDDYNSVLIQKFIISKTVKGLTERTLIHYRNTLFFVFDKVNKRIDEIAPDDLKLYFAKRQLQDKISTTTVENEFRVLSSFFGWLHTEEILPKNPMYRLEKPKKRKQKKKAFTNIEVEMMRNNCRNLREKALFEVMLSTWCRVSEIEQMDLSDICGDEMTVIGKGKKERIVYLNSKAQLAIEAYLKDRKGDSKALFCSFNAPYKRLAANQIEALFRQLGRDLGIEDVHPHRFRRTGATMALRSGMPIEKVSYLLGHESIETTQIYLDISQDDAKQAHQKYVV